MTPYQTSPRPQNQYIGASIRRRFIWRVCLFGLIALGLTSLTLSPRIARADWGYQVTEQVKPGQRAKLTFRPPLRLKSVQVTLNGGARPIIKKISQLRSDRSHSISFKVPKGHSQWVADISGLSSTGERRSVRFEFSVLSAGPLKMSFLTEQSSLEEGLLTFKANRGLREVELKAYGDEGQSLWEDKVEIKPKGALQVATFNTREEIPRRLELKVYDPYGFWQTVRVVRWYAEIPHEDVLFTSGSAEIQSSESAKMRDALDAVNQELDKFREAMGDPNASVDLQLYVAGYTDTVGQPQDNAKLSTQRARSIAQYFRVKGIQIQILYSGFGERGLLVETPDSTDEPKNRRALYVIANTPPQGATFPQARWRALR